MLMTVEMIREDVTVSFGSVTRDTVKMWLVLRTQGDRVSLKLTVLAQQLGLEYELGQRTELLINTIFGEDN